jgi:hypothetical protein
MRLVNAHQLFIELVEVFVGWLDTLIGDGRLVLCYVLD